MILGDPSFVGVLDPDSLELGGITFDDPPSVDVPVGAGVDWLRSEDP